MADRDRGERILEVAGGMFVSRGIAGTTIRQIAAEMNMSSGTIYYYYRSKESIASAILHRFIDELVEHSRAVVESSIDVEPDEQLRSLIRTSMEVAARHPNATEIYGNEASALSILPDHEEFVEKTSRTQAVWRRILAEGLERGTFRADVDAEHLREVMSHLTWMTVRWNRPNLVTDHRRIADELASLLLDGFSAA